MEELRTEEIMETAGTVVEEAAEAVAKKGGLTFGKGCAVVGGVVLVATGIYYGFKKLKNKKAKKEEAEVVVDTVQESDFEEETTK